MFKQRCIHHFEIFVDGAKIILQKYQSQQACMITGNISDENITLIEG
ncbi:hypothetical protein [Bacillus toyonensis]